MSKSAARNSIEIFLIRCGIFLIKIQEGVLLKICKQSTKRAAESQALIAGEKIFLACFEKVFIMSLHKSSGPFSPPLFSLTSPMRFENRDDDDVMRAINS
ncbi:MAG: hypothetical protein ACREOI_24185 [bacterium]